MSKTKPNYRLSIFRHGAFCRPRYSRDPFKLAQEAVLEMTDPKRQLWSTTANKAVVEVHVRRLSGRASQWRTVFMALPDRKTDCHYVI